MRAECVLDAYPDAVHPGTVSRISSIAREPGEGSLRRFFEVELALDQTDAEVMRPGMSARVEVLARRRDGVLLAPRSGLDIDSDPPRARLAGGGDREIAIELCTAQDCAITAGLAEGDELRYREETW
jgi:HlyD family secretion protein